MIGEDRGLLASAISTPTSSARKRKRNGPPSTQTGEISVLDSTREEDSYATPAPKKQKKKAPSSGHGQGEEKRLRMYRKHAPSSYLEKLRRATEQRMFMIDRTTGGTTEIPEETIEMVGSTGNIYSVHICQMPSCTCPDNQKGNQCKHIVYVLHNVLKAPDHLQYQLAFISSELREIFANARRPTSGVGSSDSENPSNRKDVSGDCPICFTEFEPESEDIVWCKAACGNNIHKECFEQWAKSQKGVRELRCVFCRTPWQEDEASIKEVRKKGRINADGYVNVALEMGLPEERGRLIEFRLE
ncbi:hypothetical protein MMC12_002096 [Toensbergia leucococca]|nr:hypothetical protein [Toensbergia leucococca]